MNIPHLLRYPVLLSAFLTVAAVAAQNLPAIPPSIDPAFWGHPNKPYLLKLTLTSTRSDGTHPPKTRRSEESVCRDSAGRVRIEDFYDSGQPKAVSIHDPNKDTITLMTVVSKSVFVLPVFRPMAPPSGGWWNVSRLPSRVIAGFSADGFRFSRTIPASAEAHRAEDTVVEEDWISNELSVVLEQKIDSQHNGTSTRTVTAYKQVEPDPTLFTVPSDYTLQQPSTAISP